jgi:hypothetical protein
MSLKLTILERAFTLAGSGQCADVAELRMRLKAEGYHDWTQLTGPALTAQLRKLIVTSRAALP